ncbi:MAG: sensor histidine kinase [Proteobacteria bacterium]|nr:sensor histidine kinase [Pseudomonadota bacterium]
MRNFGLAGTELQIDVYRLRRAIINVYENACQATDEDASDTQTNDNFLITIDTIKTNHRFEISITDNGPGIASDVLPKIFEPLYSTRSFGLGLGLPTVKQIMEQHGGNIEIETSPGQGTKMILWLSLSLAKEAAA